MKKTKVDISSLTCTGQLDFLRCHCCMLCQLVQQVFPFGLVLGKLESLTSLFRWAEDPQVASY